MIQEEYTLDEMIDMCDEILDEELSKFYDDWEEPYGDFEELSGECAIFIKDRDQAALKRYLNERGMRDTFAYDYSYTENKFTIYTCKPGIWIGRGGEGVDRLKQILSEDVKEGCNVEFKCRVYKCI